MRKLLTIALLILSPLTFAKDFNPDLLIGTWQCKGAYHFTYVDLIGIESFTETFHKDGTIESSNIIHEKHEGQKNTINLQIKGNWRVTGDILSENTENLVQYHASNQALEKKNEYGKMLREDKSFYDVKLIELTKNKYAFTQTAEDEAYGDKFKYTCHRIR